MNYKNKGNYKVEPRSTISATIPTRLWAMAKNNNISWSKATTFGIQFLLADNDVEGYEYPICNYSRKMIRIQKRLQEAYEKIEKLESQIKKNGNKGKGN